MSKMILKKGPFRNDRELVPENKIDPGREHTQEQEEGKRASRVCDTKLQCWDVRKEIGE